MRTLFALFLLSLLAGCNVRLPATSATATAPAPTVPATTTAPGTPTGTGAANQ